MASSETPSSAPFEVPPTASEGLLRGFVSQPFEGSRLSAWVLYLHGFGSNQQGEKAEFFRRRCLETGLTFVSFDFQGHGLSGGSIRDLTVSRCLRDVERVRQHVDALSSRPTVLMGSSMGGLVGLWSAAHQPAVAGAFVAPALGLDETFPSLIGDEGMRRWQEESGVLPITNELGTFELGWGFVEDLRSRRPEQLCEVHRLPTIIFQGKLDDRVSWEEVEQFADGTSDLTRLVLAFSIGRKSSGRRRRPSSASSD
jgi:pimeloyl-ACP methyl ester carboxylesterase